MLGVLTTLTGASRQLEQSSPLTHDPDHVAFIAIVKISPEFCAEHLSTHMILACFTRPGYAFQRSDKSHFAGTDELTQSTS